MQITVNSLDRKAWNAFLLEQAQSHPWHSWEWSKYLALFRGRQVLRLVIYDRQGDVVGLQSIILQPTFPIGTLADSIPMYHFSGPILREDVTQNEREEIHKELIRFFDGELKRYGTVHLTVRIWESDLVDRACLRQWVYAGFNIREGQTFTYLMGENQSSIMQRYDHDFRNQVRQGFRRGGSVQLNGQIDVRTVYELYLESMAEAGARPRYSLQEVALMLNTNENRFRDVYVCKYKGEMVAFAICLKFSCTAIYWLAGMNRKFREVRPMNLIIDEFIRNSLRQDIRRIDFGGGGTKGLFHFKRSIGAKLTSVFELTRTYSNLLFRLHQTCQMLATRASLASKTSVQFS